MDKNKMYHYIACIITVLSIFIAYDLVDNYKFYLKMKHSYQNKVEHPLVIRAFETNLEPLLKDGLRITYNSSQKNIDYFSSGFLQSVMEEVQNLNQKNMDIELSKETSLLINNLKNNDSFNETEVRISNIIEYLLYNSDNILEKEDYQNILLFYQTYLSFATKQNLHGLDKEQSLNHLSKKI